MLAIERFYGIGLDIDLGCLLDIDLGDIHASSDAKELSLFIDDINNQWNEDIKEASKNKNEMNGDDYQHQYHHIIYANKETFEYKYNCKIRDTNNRIMGEKSHQNTINKSYFNIDKSCEKTITISYTRLF